jgi:glutamyl-tRNA reductase
VSGHAVPSHVQFQITGPQDRVKHVSDHITSIAENNKSADAQISSQTTTPGGATSSTTLRVESPRRVLLLGSGRVCAPVIKMLGGHENVFITIASDVESQARDLMSLVHPSKCSYEHVKFPQDDYKLGKLIASTDVVISLLPATMHPKVGI